MSTQPSEPTYCFAQRLPLMPIRIGVLPFEGCSAGGASSAATADTRKAVGRLLLEAILLDLTRLEKPRDASGTTKPASNWDLLPTSRQHSEPSIPGNGSLHLAARATSYLGQRFESLAAGLLSTLSRVSPSCQRPGLMTETFVEPLQNPSEFTMLCHFASEALALWRTFRKQRLGCSSRPAACRDRCECLLTIADPRDPAPDLFPL